MEEQSVYCHNLYELLCLRTSTTHSLIQILDEDPLSTHKQEIRSALLDPKNLGGIRLTDVEIVTQDWVCAFH